jgi:release factor glutamine methyltransferase
MLAELTERWIPQPDKPEETPDATIRALWFAAANDPRGIGRLEHSLPELDAAGISRLRAMVDQRASGVPLAHLTGRQSFFGMELLAGPGALIPRLETHALVTGALERVREVVRTKGKALVVDLCTGAGNVALALAHSEPAVTVVGADLSEEAVELAGRNAHHLGLQDRVSFRQGDLYAPFEETRFLGSVDVITCNPPYISSAKVPLMSKEISEHEPSLAFDGGPFGVNILMRLIAQAPRFLTPGGSLCFEVGLGQGDGVRARIERSGLYADLQAVRDAKGDVRAIVVRYLPSESQPAS